MTGVRVQGLTARREAIDAAIAALTGFREVLPEAADAELGGRRVLTAGHHEDPALPENVAHRPARRDRRGNDHRLSRRRPSTPAGDRPEVGLRRWPDPGGAGQRRPDPGPGTHPSPVLRRPTEGPLVAGPALYVPRLRRPGALVRGAPPGALGGRRSHRSGQRHAALRPAPHHRAPGPARRAELTTRATPAPTPDRRPRRGGGP